MNRYTWRLQRVLDVKTKEEQLRRIELFQLAEQLAAKRSELLVRQQILQHLLAEIRSDRSPQRLGSQEFVLRRAAVDDDQIRGLREEIAALELRHKEKTAEVLAIRRFKEGLEKLRTRAQEQYLQEQERLEQRELDERTTIAFARRESGQANGRWDMDHPYRGPDT